MIFPVVILIGSLAPVISIALLLLLNFVFVLNVLGLWRMFLVLNDIFLTFLLLCSLPFFVFSVFFIFF